MDIPTRRYVALARYGGSTRGRATVPPARARTQPARPAAARANYLAHVKTHGRQPREPAVLAVFTYLTSTNPITKGKDLIPVYPVGSEAPAGAARYHHKGWPAGWSRPSTPGCDCPGI